MLEYGRTGSSCGRGCLRRGGCFLCIDETSTGCRAGTFESTAGGESEMRKKVWPLGPGCGFRGRWNPGEGRDAKLLVQRPPTFSSPGIIYTEWSVQDKALACFRWVCFFSWRPCLPCPATSKTEDKVWNASPKRSRRGMSPTTMQHSRDECASPCWGTAS